MTKRVILASGIVAASCLNEEVAKYNPNNYGGTGDFTNCVGGWITEAGSLMSYTFACHRFMNKVPDNAKAVWTLNCKPPKGLTIQQHQTHFNWLTDPESSPWRSLLAAEPVSDTHNPEFWWNKGFVFTNFLNMPANLVMNFFVALRMIKEWPDSIAAWHYLVTKFDIDPALAYTALRLFNKLPSAGCETSFTFRTSDFYDWPLNNGTCGEEYVRNFCYGEPVGAKGTLSIRNEGQEPYGEINTVWGPCYSKNTKPTYQSILFDLYSSELGSVSDKKRMFTDNNTRSVSTWSLSFKEMIKLLHLEEERLLRAQPKTRAQQNASSRKTA